MSRPRDPEKEEKRVGAEAAKPAAQDPAADGADPQPGAPAESSTDARSLGEQLAKLQAEKKDLLNALVRQQADFENYRKRVERERREDHDRALAALAEKLLPVLDGFERALAAHQDPAYAEYRAGFELLYRQLREILARQGVTQMEAVGKRFDPHYHHAVERVESDEFPDGTVIEQLQAGYKFRDRVLRPAMVRVAIQPVRKTADTESGVN